jgi:hypothetical protein
VVDSDAVASILSGPRDLNLKSDIESRRLTLSKQLGARPCFPWLTNDRIIAVS